MRVNYCDKLRIFLVADRFPSFETHFSLGTLLSFRANEAEDGTERGAIVAYVHELKLTPIEELERRVSQARAALRQRVIYEREFGRGVPDFDPDYIAADFNWWALQPYWTAEEAATLTMGADPRRCDREQLQPHAEYKPFAAKVIDICDLIERSQHCGDLESLIPPKEFLEWVDGGRLELPPALIAAVIAAPPRVRSSIARIAELEKQVQEVQSADSRPLHAKRRRTFARLTLAFANETGHDPDKKRNSTAKQMSDACTKAGHSVSEDTICNLLKECPDLAGRNAG